MSSDKARGTHFQSSVEKDVDVAASGNAKRGTGRYRGGGGKSSGKGGGGEVEAKAPRQQAAKSTPVQAVKPVPSRAAAATSQPRGRGGAAVAAAKSVQPLVLKEDIEMDAKTKALSQKLTECFFNDELSRRLSRKFLLSKDEANSVTHRADDRDKFIAILLDRVARKKGFVTIMDTHSGAGGDALLFMRMLKKLGCKSHLILTQPPCDNGRDERLRANVEAYRAVIDSPDVVVDLFATRFQDALSTLVEVDEEIKVDFINIDVPWELPAGYTEDSCRGKSKRAVEITRKIIRRIVDDVINPLAEQDMYMPSLICLKVPAEYEQYEEELMAATSETSYLKPYMLLKEMPVYAKDRLRYYYIFLIHKFD